MFIFGVTVVLYFVKILSGSRNFTASNNNCNNSECDLRGAKITIIKISWGATRRPCSFKTPKHRFLGLVYNVGIPTSKPQKLLESSTGV